MNRAQRRAATRSRAPIAWEAPVLCDCSEHVMQALEPLVCRACSASLGLDDGVLVASTCTAPGDVSSWAIWCPECDEHAVYRFGVLAS